MKADPLQEEIRKLSTEIEDKKRLLAQKQAEVLQRERKQREDRLEIAMRHIDALLDFFPEHEGDCNDTNLAGTRGGRCNRCILLTTKRNNYWDSDYEIKLKFVDKG